MGDMSAIIVPKSDQINADDLLGRTMTITVSGVKIRGGQEQPISIEFEGSDKVFRPCKSMCRVLAQAWGLDSSLYRGKSMTLYCDPTVKFGPLAVGGIRISHMSHIDGPMVMALTATKGVKKSYKVLPLVAPVEPAATAAITREQAELDMRAAPGLDELKVCWMRKIMAPHREALADVLEECKSALALIAADMSVPADASAMTPDDIIDLIGRKVQQQDVISLVDSWADQIATFVEADVLRIDAAKSARIAELKGAA
jgi:hypothetical protein